MKEDLNVSAKIKGRGGTVPSALMVGSTRWYITMDFKCCTLVSTDENTDIIFVLKNSLVRLRQGTPARTHFISGLKSQVLKLTFLTYKN